MNIVFNHKPASEREINKFIDRMDVFDTEEYKEIINEYFLFREKNYKKYSISFTFEKGKIKFSIYGLKDRMYIFIKNGSIDRDLESKPFFHILKKIEKVFRFGGKKMMDKDITIQCYYNISSLPFYTNHWLVGRDTTEDIQDSILESVEENSDTIEKYENRI